MLLFDVACNYQLLKKICLSLLTGIMSYVMVITHRGGTLQIESLGIQAVIPPNAVSPGQTQQIKISAITNVSKYVPKEKKEMWVAFGIECLPDGTNLRAPVTIIIPHCIPLLQVKVLEPVVYSGRGNEGDFH